MPASADARRRFQLELVLATRGLPLRLRSARGLRHSPTSGYGNSIAHGAPRETPDREVRPSHVTNAAKAIRPEIAHRFNGGTAPARSKSQRDDCPPNFTKRGVIVVFLKWPAPLVACTPRGYCSPRWPPLFTLLTRHMLLFQSCLK